MNFFRNKRAEEAEAKVAEHIAYTQAISQRLAELEAKLKKDEELGTIDYESDEPQVAIVSSGLDPVQGIRIELDWNDSFIEYLKASGFEGPDEESIVQRWLAGTAKDLAERIKPGTSFA